MTNYFILGYVTKGPLKVIGEWFLDYGDIDMLQSSIVLAVDGEDGIAVEERGKHVASYMF